MESLDLSYTALNILALSKLILFFYGALMLFFVYKNKKPIWCLVLTGASVILFYIILSWPLQRMWWGNVGDELFVAGFLGKVLFDGPAHDFYYGWLPNFYPPLYFWVTGLISRPFAHNAIVAAKIGIIGTLFLWFYGTYFWQKVFWDKISTSLSNKKNIVESNWFWFLYPLIYLAVLDFDSILLKPYEAIAALFGVLWMGIMARSFYEKKWTKYHFIFIGISGGILFLIYYFWWAIFIPTLLILVFLNKERLLPNLKRLIYSGLIILAISSIFLGPLFYSYVKYGVENGQAIHFIYSDFFSFIPWGELSIRSLIYIFGLLALIIFYKKSFIKASLIIVILSYLYQFVNIFIFLLGGQPVQASKHFYFLATAAMASGFSYLAIYVYQRYIKDLEIRYKRGIIFLALALLLTRLPFVNFIDDKVILHQIDKNLQKPQVTIQLAEDIKIQIPDYKNRIWLSSGSMELSIYLPLSYYIAHNIHFSHHASMYSQRTAEVEAMARASSPEEFMAIIGRGQPKPIDSLLIYDDNQDDYYTLYFWHDNFPNGGKEAQIYLPKELIVDKYWDKIYNKNNWLIFLKKD